MRAYFIHGLILGLYLSFLCASDPQSRSDRGAWFVVAIAMLIWPVVVAGWVKRAIAPERRIHYYGGERDRGDQFWVGRGDRA